METRTYNVYKFEELSKEGKAKAIKNWQNNNHFDMLSQDMAERLNELLKENRIEGDPKLQYSLSYNQGDGAMFYGDFDWKGYSVEIKTSGHYSHSNSKKIDFPEFVGEDKERAEEKIAEEFEAIYQGICGKLEDFGYGCIDAENDERNIIDTFEANEYLFTEDGRID